MYEKEAGLEKVSRRFVPVFPFLYDDLRQGRLLSNAELYLPKPSQNVIPLPKP